MKYLLNKNTEITVSVEITELQVVEGSVYKCNWNISV